MVNIGKHKLETPLIQGGMGVGVSLSSLAGAVAAQGAMGVISTANIGFDEPDFDKAPFEANKRALKKHIEKAFEIADGKGLVAINAMVETSDYETAVQTAVECGINAVICGAGLPLELPKFTKGTNTAAAPIVSSGRCAKLICRSWDRNFAVVPDFIVIEGANAGGHLGFSRESLLDGTTQSLDEILKDVLEAIKPFEEKYEREIPVFVAGSIFDAKDRSHIMGLGASGVQIATRFICTPECDASDTFKQIILDAKEKDLMIIKSPVGMPGRAVKTELFKRLEKGEKFPSDICSNCLKHCPHGLNAPFCISRALIAAVKGDTENGLFFTGANVERVNQMMSVKEIIDEVMN